MNFLGNTGFKQRLMIILSVWIFLFVLFGVFAMSEMTKIGNVTKSIYLHPLKVSNAAIEARVDIIKIQRDMRDLLVMSKVSLIHTIESINPIEQRVYQNLEVIRTNNITPDSMELGKEAIDLFSDWNASRQAAIEMIMFGSLSSAQNLITKSNSEYVEKLEDILVKIDNSSRRTADELVIEAESIEKTQRSVLIIVITMASVIFILFFILMSNSILKPIRTLKAAMDNSTNTGDLTFVTLEGKNEIVDMASYYNVLVHKLRDIFWIKDVQNNLSQILSGHSTLSELSHKAINYISEISGSGKGVLYISNNDDNTLRLLASFAITRNDRLYEQIYKGEGIIGQAALQKKPIYLNNIKKSDDYISTGFSEEAPLNTYTFPLIYEDELLGVISLASFEHFGKVKLEALNECSRIIAVNLYSAIQTQKVKDLLADSEIAREEARQTACELKEANNILQQQQELLQQQTEELQQTNSELEEQQQLLQQQSEELQQTNMQLEEQQQQLEEQATLLNHKNIQLEEASKELIRRSEQLESSNRYKSEFLANMSHELRTPLNSIILLSKLLLNKTRNVLSDSDWEKVDIINSSGKELLRLINDILDLSKIEAGHMTLDIQEIETGLLIKELKRMFEGVANEKQITLYVEDEVKSILKGDIHKISQILRNFISNAIKFTQQGYVSIKALPDTSSEGGVRFIVKDTGIGISEEQKQIIFEEFQQGDGSVSRKYGGTGLGLSISKKLSDLLGGEIAVNSEIGIGSEFSLCIPKLISDSSTSGYSHNLSQLAEEEAAVGLIEDIQLPSSNDKIILVIEDDSGFSEYLKEIIYGMGLIPIVSSNGRDGLILAKQYRPHGILLDLGLPDMSGIDVLREIKRTVELREIPVHVVSIWDRDSKLQKMGALGFKQKPVEEAEVVKLITNMINFSEKNPKQLLLIEDDTAQQEAIKELISSDDIHVKVVETQKSAETELIKGIYDVIVLDLGLKEGSGINVCRFIGEKNIEIPVIVYTGKDLSLDEEKAIRTYADSIIIKTANSEERLLDEVTLFLHKVRRNKKQSFYLNSKTNEEISLNLSGKTILVADDDPRNVYVLATALEQYGAEIVEAGDGRKALEKLHAHKVDLVLMDVMMPEIDGFEAIRMIRSDEKIKDIPIIAVTAKSLMGDREKCIESGANDYIAKPVDFDILVRLVRAWINK